MSAICKSLQIFQRQTNIHTLSFKQKNMNVENDLLSKNYITRKLQEQLDKVIVHYESILVVLI